MALSPEILRFAFPSLFRNMRPAQGLMDMGGMRPINVPSVHPIEMGRPAPPNTGKAPSVLDKLFGGGEHSKLRAGLAIMAAANQPGATFAGSVAQGSMVGQQDAQQQQAEAARQAELAQMAHLGSGNVDRPTLQKMFAQAIASGDVQSAQAIASAMKALPTASSLPKYVQKVGINPATGQPEQYWANPANPAESPRWTGIAPPPTHPLVSLNTVPNAIASAQGEEYKTASKGAREAQDQISSLDTMSGLLDSGMSTGGLQELTINARNVAAGLGLLSPDASKNLSQQQLFQSIAKKLTLQAKPPGLQRLTNFDLQILEKTIPQISDTELGNRLMIEMLRRAAQRRVDLFHQMEDYASTHNNTLSGWAAYRDKWLKENPLSFHDIAQRAQAEIEAAQLAGGGGQ